MYDLATPRKARLFFLLLLWGGLLVIWVGYFASLHALQVNALNDLKSNARAESILLEDHASRTLDTVSERLNSLSALPEPGSFYQGPQSSPTLDSLIYGDRMVRSLSLVDSGGRVVASSSPRNVGVRLPPAVLRQLMAGQERGNEQFGPVLPYRDLDDLARGQASDHVKLWLISRAAAYARKGYQWVAVVNPGLFENLWSRVDKREVLGIALFNYQGQPITGINLTESEQSLLQAQLQKRNETSAHGYFETGAGNRYFVSYRASINHPFLLVVAGDRQALYDRLAQGNRHFRFIALALSFVTVLAVGLLYRGYRSYESTAREMTNQNRAISAHMMVSEADPQGEIIAVNEAFLDTSGYSREEVLGRTHRLFNSGFHDQAFYQNLWQTINAGRIWKGTLRNMSKDGQFYWVSATIVPFTDVWGKITRFVAFYTDITDAISISQRLESERRLRAELTQIHQDLVSIANTDPLTKLPNRRAFESYIGEALEKSRQHAKPLSLLMLDLDKFKEVNDTHGHAAGDEILRTVSRRWARLVRSSDMVARLGGEEFCMLLPNADRGRAKEIAGEILSVTRVPVEWSVEGQPRPIRVTVSIGLTSLVPEAGTTVDGLLELADSALYEAKRAGRDRVACAREGAD
ncbi:MAG: diguanylate cyclase [Betaproteobacteria bacterium]|nr:diguanylate cyclase [Betaproteobacteria bacterium]